ncbi:MAG: hypothetical protein V4663_09270 [Bacteroidota bacterium]
MKTKITKSVSILTLLLIASLYGKAQSFTKDTKIISAGIGLGSSLWGTGGKGRPAISANFEKGAWELGDAGVVSLGGYIGNTGYKSTYKFGSYISEDKWSYTVIGARSAFHYSGLNNDVWDIYGGLMLSYNIASYSFKDNDSSYDYDAGGAASGLGFTGYVGGRYNFSEKLGAYAELGYGVSVLALGVSIKF